MFYSESIAFLQEVLLEKVFLSTKGEFYQCRGSYLI